MKHSHRRLVLVATSFGLLACQPAPKSAGPDPASEAQEFEVAAGRKAGKPPATKPAPSTCSDRLFQPGDLCMAAQDWKKLAAERCRTEKLALGDVKLSPCATEPTRFSGNGGHYTCCASAPLPVPPPPSPATPPGAPLRTPPEPGPGKCEARENPSCNDHDSQWYDARDDCHDRHLELRSLSFRPCGPGLAAAFYTCCAPPPPPAPARCESITVADLNTCTPPAVMRAAAERRCQELGRQLSGEVKPGDLCGQDGMTWGIASCCLPS